MKRSLTQSYNECIEQVQEMQGAIEKIRSSMAPFEEAVSEQDKVRKIDAHTPVTCG